MLPYLSEYKTQTQKEGQWKREKKERIGVAKRPRKSVWWFHYRHFVFNNASASRKSPEREGKIKFE